MVFASDHADAALAAEFSPLNDENNDFWLVYAGGWTERYVGTLSLTFTNSAGLTSTTTWTLKLGPFPPTFDSDPISLTVINGYDLTYSYPAITDGSATPSQLSVSMNTVGADRYTLDSVAKTITIKGTKTGTFEPLIGTTLTLSTNLYNSKVGKDYT